MSFSPRSSSESERSLYWISPDSPLPPGIESYDTLRSNGVFTLHDGTDETLRPCRKDSVSSDDSAQRRCHVFGTPTYQAGTADESTNTDSKIEIAYGDVGMDIARDSRGGTVGSSQSSDGFAGSIRSMFRQEGSNFAMSQGGKGLTAWVLLDQPGTVLPECFNGNPNRRNSANFTTSDGTTSRRSDHAASDHEPPLPPVLDLSASPPTGVRRRSIESKFSEDLPVPRRTNTPLQWIKKRVKRKSDKGRVDTSTTGRKGNYEDESTTPPRKLRKPLSTVKLLSETADASPSSNADLPEHLSIESNIIRVDRAAVSPSDSPFLSQVDDALIAGKPTSKLRRLSTTIKEAGRRFSVAPTGSTVNNAPAASSFEGINLAELPPRSQSVPPQQNRKNSLWNLEFLPTEAQGVRTPDEYPIYDPKQIGGKVMPRSKEMKYFNLADMVQSQPPLAPVGETSGRLDPKADPGLMTSSTSVLHSYSDLDCRAIAPFIDQDQECDRSVKETTPNFATAKSSGNSFSATGQKIRRASIQARNIISGKLPDVSETPEVASGRRKSASSGKGLPEGKYPESVPRRVRSGRGVVKWIKRASADNAMRFSGRNMRRGQYEPDLEITKPAEVVIEEARRQKRDSGVIGLDPADTQSSSTDDSFTYTSALRDIAGLTKRPKGPAASNGKSAPVIGELVTPPPPGFPPNSIPPGSLLQLAGENVSKDESSGGRK